MNRVEEVAEFANKLVGKWFDEAPLGQKTKLKNY